MRAQWHLPKISGIAITLSGVVLAIMAAARFLPLTLNRGIRFFAFGGPSLSVIAICVLALMMLVLIVFKLIGDRRTTLERDLLEAFLDHIPDNVFFKDRESRFIRISRGMARHIGLADPSVAVNKTDADIFSSEHAEQALADEREILRTGEAKVGIDEKETWQDGHENWVFTTKVALRNQKGQIIGTMGISRDITERKQAEARIHYMALHDSLTGLPNRALLQERLGQTIALAACGHQKFAVLMLDLDRFKDVNDSLGHYVGDRLLEAVSACLKSCLRECDIVARFAGDEFVIVLPMIDDEKSIERVAQKILNQLAKPFCIEGRELRISGSIGIGQYPADGETAEVLLQSADDAMYEAKKVGRASFRFFTASLNEATKRRRELENDLRKACAQREFILHYQPVVSTVSGHISAVEALLRWHRPDQGLVNPSHFIPLLEELGLMSEVGNWVLRTACQQNVAWQKEGLAPIRMAVNVSAQQFQRGNLARTVEEVLQETELDPKWLELELTESLAMENTEKVIEVMHELKRIGVSLALDDFGTGWSSLSYLRRFPLDRLKIDRSFMRDVGSQPAAEAVVRGIMGLARSLGLACTGEGVETHQQLHYLQKRKCSDVQGFLYSPALPADECGEMLRTRYARAQDPPKLMITEIIEAEEAPREIAGCLS
jgi:diguanylate cyclase (GGDEF)-like protein/PAS domain S-box-containing protein